MAACDVCSPGSWGVCWSPDCFPDTTASSTERSYRFVRRAGIGVSYSDGDLLYRHWWICHSLGLRGWQIGFVKFIRRGRLRLIRRHRRLRFGLTQVVKRTRVAQWTRCLFPPRSLCTEWHLTLWVAIGTCGATCGGHDNRRHHVSRSGSLIGLRSVARFGWRDVSGVWYIVWELCDRFWDERYCVKCAYDYGCESPARLLIVTSG